MKPLALILALAGALWHRPAHACGGCTAPPDTITTVDSHRMVISLSPTRTILWDQIRYTGEPDDFAWILPVPTPAATLEIASSAFFDELQWQTQVAVQPPPLPSPDCPPPPYNGGGGGVADGGPSLDAGVDVYREEVVGPYETAVIGSSDAGALYAWLHAHNYEVTTDARPVFEYYIARGSVFIVLRLAPQQGVSAMQPVRVTYPGYMSTFPLKMVTVGAYAQLDLTLWVYAEQRYAAHNYGTAVIDPADLVWDFATGQSNYRALFAAAVESLGGRGWVAEYAQGAGQLWFSADGAVEADLARQAIPAAFVTRLRTSARVEHLVDDLVLAPAQDSAAISNFLLATNAINVPPCPDYNNDGRPDTWADYYASRHDGFLCTIGLARRSLPFSVAAIAIFGLLVWRTRRRR